MAKKRREPLTDITLQDACEGLRKIWENMAKTNKELSSLRKLAEAVGKYRDDPDAWDHELTAAYDAWKAMRDVE